MDLDQESQNSIAFEVQVDKNYDRSQPDVSSRKRWNVERPATQTLTAGSCQHPLGWEQRAPGAPAPGWGQGLQSGNVSRSWKHQQGLFLPACPQPLSVPCHWPSLTGGRWVRKSNAVWKGQAGWHRAELGGEGQEMDLIHTGKRPTPSSLLATDSSFPAPPSRPSPAMWSVPSPASQLLLCITFVCYRCCIWMTPRPTHQSRPVWPASLWGAQGAPSPGSSIIC